MEIQRNAVSPIGNIKQGWELIKNDYWMLFAMMLVLLVITVAISFVLGLVVAAISGAISIAVGVASAGAGDAGRAAASIVPQLISQFLNIITSLIVGTLSGVLYCGIYKGLSRRANGGQLDFGDLFTGFENILQCFIVSLIFSIIQFAFGVVMIFIGFAAGASALAGGLVTPDGKLNPAITGALLSGVLIIALIYLVVALIFSSLTIFTYPLIADRKMTALEALTTSIKAGFSNLLGIIGLLIVLFFMLFGGTMLCFVGLLFVLPLLPSAIFTAYLNVFGKAPHIGKQSPPPPPVF
jgi:hypothetical protein